MELTAIKLPVRTSYRLQLSFFRLYLRGSPPSVCPALLCNPRRNQVVPTDLHSSVLCTGTHTRSRAPVKRLSHSPDMMASVLTQNDLLAPFGAATTGAGGREIYRHQFDPSRQLSGAGKQHRRRQHADGHHVAPLFRRQPRHRAPCPFDPPQTGAKRQVLHCSTKVPRFHAESNNFKHFSIGAGERCIRMGCPTTPRRHSFHDECRQS